MTRKIKLTTEIIKKLKEENKTTIQVVDRTPPLSKSLANINQKYWDKIAINEEWGGIDTKDKKKLRSGIFQRILKDGKLFHYVNPNAIRDKNDCRFISPAMLADFQKIFDGEKQIKERINFVRDKLKKVKDLNIDDIIRPDGYGGWELIADIIEERRLLDQNGRPASPEAFKFLQDTIAGEVKVIYEPGEYDLAEFEGVENLADANIQAKVTDINSQPKEKENNSSETNENNNDEERTNEQHSSNGSNSLQEIEITLSIDTGKRSEIGGVPVYRTEKMKTRWEFPLPIKITGNKGKWWRSNWDHADYTIEPINITSLNGDRNLEIDMLTLRFRTWEDGNQRGRPNADQYVLAEIPNFVDETNADWFGDRKEVKKIPDRLLAVGDQIQLELAAKSEKSISSSRKASNWQLRGSHDSNIFILEVFDNYTLKMADGRSFRFSENNLAALIKKGQDTKVYSRHKGAHYILLTGILSEIAKSGETPTEEQVATISELKNEQWSVFKSWKLKEYFAEEEERKKVGGIFN